MPNDIPVTTAKSSSEELNHAKKQVKDIKDLLQSVFDTSLIGMSVLQAQYSGRGQIEDFLIMIVNKQLERETGRTDLVGKLYKTEFPGIISSGLWDLMLKVMETGEAQHLEYFYPYDGFNNWYSCMFVKIDDGLVATNLDITSRKRAEEEKAKMTALHNQKTFWATLQVQEEERKRIAETLHNGLGQMLYGIKMNLELLNYSEQERDPSDFKEIKSNINHMVDQTIKECRQISHELTPAILEDFGLKVALNDLCQQFSQTLKIKCYYKGLTGTISKNMEVAIYRTAQELIVNAIKHAKATIMSVRITITNLTIFISVHDNGVGFDKEIKSTGIGLKTIKNKVKLLNGSYHLISNKGKGSTVNIIIPYANN